MSMPFCNIFSLLRYFVDMHKESEVLLVNLYDKIQELCKNANLSVNKMCIKAGIRSSVLYDLKSGKKSDLNRKTAEKIATALEITVDELYGKEKTPDAEAPRDSKYNEIFNLFYGLSEDNISLAVKGLAYLVKIPDEKLPEAVRYLQFLADAAEN
jgi:transcriptional regulator with XRE-family HTH domain